MHLLIIVRFGNYDRNVFLITVTDKVIVFVTDGKSTDVDPEKVLDVISEENSKLDNVVVIMTYYLGERKYKATHNARN